MSAALPNYEQAAAVVTAYASELSKRVRPSSETVELGRAQGRVLAQPVRADQDQPPFARSTRDGFACRAEEASMHAPLRIAGSTHAGEAPAGPLPGGSAWEIMTGAPVPVGADCVVMLEHVEKTGGTHGDHIRLHPSRKIETGDNVVAQGAQAHAGDQLLHGGSALGAAQIALAASCGNSTVDVFARPRVAILTTGDELVPVDAAPGLGQIRNSNAPMLAALVANAGGEPWVLPNAADTDQALDEALRHAAEADMLLISGGVSAGKFDLVEPALARIGARFHFTGVRIQPGKPLVFGEVPKDGASGSSNLPFFGLPGNPISSAATFLLFAAPVLAALSGSSEFGPRFALARLHEETNKKGKSDLTRFLPARCNFNPPASELPQVEAVPWHGSGDLAAFARSNCFLVVPDDAGLLEAGSVVRILLF
jgi:molybdopterin molybdotransferase